MSKIERCKGTIQNIICKLLKKIITEDNTNYIYYTVQKVKEKGWAKTGRAIPWRILKVMTRNLNLLQSEVSHLRDKWSLTNRQRKLLWRCWMQVHYRAGYCKELYCQIRSRYSMSSAWGRGELQHLPSKFLLAGVFWTNDRALMWYSQVQKVSDESEEAKKRILTRISTVGTIMKDEAAASG